MSSGEANKYIAFTKEQNLPSEYLSKVSLDHVKFLTKSDMIKVATESFCKVTCPDRYSTCNKSCSKKCNFYITLEEASRKL